jgi:hypothetical protein
MLASGRGRKSHLAVAAGRRHPREVAEETVIYRLEVITIMEMLGDIRHDLAQVRALLEEDDGEEEEEGDAEG